MNAPKPFAAALLCAACLFVCSCASTFSDESPDNSGFDGLLESVVKIDVWEKSQKDGGNLTTRAIGSGVIIDGNGTILTNAHVVNCYATKIVVTLANLERVKADFVGWDHWTDLALIRLDGKDLEKRGLKFKHADFGDSSKLKSGQVVYAVGTPHGFARTVTRGIISNTSRYFEGTILNSGYETGNFNTWLQTDAAINPGNSGGPLVLPNGKIVGINTRARTNSNNLGFAVPSNVAQFVADALEKSPLVERGYIGVTPAPLQDMEHFYEIAVNRGVLVQNVDADSPAAKVGVQPGDIILKIDDAETDGRFPEQLPDIMNKIATKKSATPCGSRFCETEKSSRNRPFAKGSKAASGANFRSKNGASGFRKSLRFSSARRKSSATPT